MRVWIFHMLVRQERRSDGRTKGYKSWNADFIKDKTSNTNAPLVPPRCFQRNCARQCFFLNWLRVLERKERTCGKSCWILPSPFTCLTCRERSPMKIEQTTKLNSECESESDRRRLLTLKQIKLIYALETLGERGPLNKSRYSRLSVYLAYAAYADWFDITI